MSDTTVQIHGETFRVFLHNEQIEMRIAELGRKISQDYEGLHPIFVIVLNGAFMFAGSLLKSIHIACQTDFIRLSSYEATQSTGKVYQILGLSEAIEGRNIIIVEDIVDTGLSMKYLIGEIKKRNPQSVRVATLFFKPTAIKEAVPLDYVGFEIENQFVVGYGLDYDGLGRNYPDLYVIDRKN